MKKIKKRNGERREMAKMKKKAKNGEIMNNGVRKKVMKENESGEESGEMSIS